MKIPILYVVIPCFNEEKVLPETSVIFLTELKRLIDSEKINSSSRILFVDDGSTDNTWDIILSLAKEDKLVTGISLSRNRGHQNALLAGLTEACGKCDITVSLDCDGQDDISVLEKMIDEYISGCDIVYGVRCGRKKDSLPKRVSARLFYRFLRFMGVETVYDHADYRLMSSKAVKALLSFSEENLYLRGTIPLVGFKSTAVEYERLERKAGKSHYTLKNMISLGLNAVTGLSIKPLRIISFFGILVSLISAVGIVWSLFQYFFGTTVSGWTSLVCVICFLSGVQLLSLGVVGEYIGKIYMETKKRPRFIVAEKTDENDSDG